eukprot:scaffold70768_cov52-Cyclotella_meneghiniana.AAC.4
MRVNVASSFFRHGIRAIGRSESSLRLVLKANHVPSAGTCRDNVRGQLGGNAGMLTEKVRLKGFVNS